jgi:hypothetical protein
LLARRADTRARADFATWKMMVKLNGADALPAEAQKFLAGYQALLAGTSEAEATEATIHLMYRTYFAEMGGTGTPPELAPRPREPVSDNVTAFRRPPPQPRRSPYGASGQSRLPVALIFACLVVVYVGIRYFWK